MKLPSIGARVEVVGYGRGTVLGTALHTFADITNTYLIIQLDNGVQIPIGFAEVSTGRIVLQELPRHFRVMHVSTMEAEQEIVHADKAAKGWKETMEEEANRIFGKNNWKWMQDKKLHIQWYIVSTMGDCLYVA